MGSISERLLRLCLKTSAGSATTRNRFLIDTFATPTLYLQLTRKLGKATRRATTPEARREAFDTMMQNLTRDVPLLQNENNVGLSTDTRFRTWARRAFLHAYYGHAAPEADVSAELLKANKAPTAARLHEVFPHVNAWKPQDAAKDNATPVETLPPASEVENMLESIGCCVKGTNAFHVWCERYGVYDMFSDEWVDGLSQSILRNHSSKLGKERIKVLEIGAGDGRLSHLLRHKLSQSGVTANAVEVHATDPGVWRIPTSFPVTKQDFQQALKSYRPHVVLVSWMPLGVDWTRSIRATPTVDHYYLVGEHDATGCCGHPYWTWGDVSSMENPAQAESDAPPIDIFDYLSRVQASQQSSKAKRETSLTKPPESKQRQSGKPYERDGFERVNLQALSKLQVCRYDRTGDEGNSWTVCFQRKF